MVSTRQQPWMTSSTPSVFLLVSMIPPMVSSTVNDTKSSGIDLDYKSGRGGICCHFSMRDMSTTLCQRLLIRRPLVPLLLILIPFNDLVDPTLSPILCDVSEWNRRHLWNHFQERRPKIWRRRSNFKLNQPINNKLHQHNHIPKLYLYPLALVYLPLALTWLYAWQTNRTTRAANLFGCEANHDL